MKKACIVGAAPETDSSFLPLRKKDCFLVACDGGYHLFLKEKIEPDLLVGDFDTLDPKRILSPKQVIKLSPIKDDTDTFHALTVLLEQGFDRFYFYGCLGGKIEHTIANIQVLSFLREQHAKGWLYSGDGKQVVTLLQNEAIDFYEGQMGMVSVFAYQEKAEDVTEQGLKYSITDKTLSDAFPTLGVSNELTGEAASIYVRSGKLLVVAPSESYRQE